MVATTRYSPHFGGLLSALVSLYALFVAANLMLTGERGPLRSPELILAALLVGATLFGDLGGRAKVHLLRNALAVVLILLAAHIVLGAARVPLAEGGVLLSSHLVEMLRGFVIGFIAASGLRLRVRLPGRHWVNSAAGAALLVTIAFWAVVASILLTGREAIRTDLFGLLTRGDYYQMFGDYYAIAVAVTLGAQLVWFESLPSDRRSYVAFTAAVLGQGVASFFLLQLIGSNKTPVLVALMCLFTLAAAKPQYWIGRGWHIRKRGLVDVAGLAALLAASLMALGQFELPRLRIFGYGQAGGVFQTTSVTSRNEFLVDQGIAHLMDSPIMGNPGLGIVDGAYVHSLLTVQTHLGIVGTILVALLLLTGWSRLQTHPEAGFLRVALVPVLVVGTISSFYVWLPFWFLIGGLAGLPPAALLNRT